MFARWLRSFLARQRLALWSAAILALALLFIGALLMAALEANLRREVDEALLLRAQHVDGLHLETGRDQAGRHVPTSLVAGTRHVLADPAQWCAHRLRPPYRTRP